MPVSLTETAIQKAIRNTVKTGKRVDLADATLPGLRLRLTPAGGRSWVLACRDSLGAMRRFPLGAHPTLGIAQARDAARAMRAEVAKGADPVAERRRQRAVGREARDGIGTLTALLDLYALRKGGALKSWPECRRRIDSVFAAHRGKPVAMLKAGDLQMTADAHTAKQSAAAAVRYLRPVLKWAAQRGYVAPETASLYPPAVVGRRDRVITTEELGTLLPTLVRSTRPYAAALQFMLLTLARREEVAGTRWSDVDTAKALWTLPDTKSGRPFTVPLSRQAIALLDAIRPEKALMDAFVFRTAAGGRLGNWDRETKAIMQVSGTKNWTRHDLQRTGATLLGEMGTEPHVIEAALNHAEVHSRLASTYNRSRYQPAVAMALQRLADALDGIGAGDGKVVPMRAKAEG